MMPLSNPTWQEKFHYLSGVIDGGNASEKVKMLCLDYINGLHDQIIRQGVKLDELETELEEAQTQYKD